MPASRTAEYVALYRALENSERRRAPLFRDPLASSFLTGGRSIALGVANVPGLRGLLERYADWRAPGARTSAIGRTRFIDDVVRAEVAAGTRQIVILGAGYDSRAHRLPELATVRVYEVDRADTQAEKQRRLELVEGKRKDVRYVAVDFERQHLPSELADAGWRADQRSLFIWEGVTNYLDEAAVGAVLDMVGHTAPDTAIVFTYIHRGVIDGTRQFLGADKLVASVKKLGEPWRTGFVPDELPAFVASLGLRIEQDLGADDYRARYFGDDTRLAGYAFYRIAVARVQKP
ncbi:MAG: SAM-dependent methyltransferase [Kofleriaceae bacterium]|nr:SAM-dependent methyltransferase [Kofleriaceae bacterium]